MLRLSEAVQYGRSKANEAFTESGVIRDSPEVKLSPTPLMNRPSLICRRDPRARVTNVSCLVIHHTASSSHPGTAPASTAVLAVANARRVRRNKTVTRKRLAAEEFHWCSSACYLHLLQSAASCSHLNKRNWGIIEKETVKATICSSDSFQTLWGNLFFTQEAVWWITHVRGRVMGYRVTPVLPPHCRTSNCITGGVHTTNYR